MGKGMEAEMEVVVANLLVTARCNIACEFCLNVWKDKSLSTDSVRSFVRDLRACRIII